MFRYSFLYCAFLHMLCLHDLRFERIGLMILPCYDLRAIATQGSISLPLWFIRRSLRMSLGSFARTSLEQVLTNLGTSRPIKFAPMNFVSSLRGPRTHSCTWNPAILRPCRGCDPVLNCSMSLLGSLGQFLSWN